MLNDRKTWFAPIVSIALLLAMLAGAICTVPALADGGTTAPTPAPTAPATDPSTRTAPSAGSASAQLPKGAKVVILDAAGNPIPLGSQQAADIVSSGDPVWCPATLAAPTPGMNGCSNPVHYTSTSLDSLLTYLSGNQGLFAKNGTIWIEDTYASNTEDPGITSFTLDGSAAVGYHFGTLKNYSLTIQGGWTGTTIGTASTFDGASLSILNWGNTVTVNNVVIQNATGDGLTVTTSKSIALKKVTASHNTGNGINLTSSGGSIRVDAVTASTNGAAGALLDNHAAAGQSVTVSAVSGSNVFDSNYTDGLHVLSSGAVSITNVDASNNGTSAAAAGGVGAWLQNDAGNGTLTVTTTSSSIYNTFNGNYSCLGGISCNAQSGTEWNGGLTVLSHGTISLKNIIANGDLAGVGAEVDNSGAAPSSPKAVTLAGTNTFNNNYSDGLDVLSLGAVATNNLTADNNGAGGILLPEAADGGVDGSGVFIENSITGTKGGGVALTGSNVFDGNYFTGLAVQSDGSITASNVSADNSTTGAGASLQNYATAFGPHAITVTNTLSNTFNNNYFDGLDAIASGSIMTTNLTANGNGLSTTTGGGVGARLENDSNSSVNAVTLKGTNTFTGNYSTILAPLTSTYSDFGGLTVISTGAISANNLTASGDLAAAGAYLANSGAGSAQSVTLTGQNVFTDNAKNDGLDVFSRGAITASNLVAIQNGGLATPPFGDGVYLDNCGFDGTACSLVGSQPITVTGNSAFKYNGFNGLEVHSNGTITVFNVSANHNGAGSAGSGASLDNCNFNSSILIPACSSPLGKGVTVAGTNFFDGNADQGLVVSSQGSITAGNITANDNMGRWGANLFNGYAGVTAGVSLTGTNVLNGNGHDGLTVGSNGAIAVNNLTANDDGQTMADNVFGAFLVNVSGANTGVSLTGTNMFNGNFSGGLYVQSKGAIKVNNVTATDSVNGPGATLINDTGPSASGVTLTGFGVFSDNQKTSASAADGIDINSNGLITLAKITADGNVGDGLSINNGAPSYVSPYTYSFSATPKNVTITCGSFVNNGGYGVDIHSSAGKIVTLVGVTLAENGSGDTPNLTGSGTLAPIVRACSLP